MSGKSTELTDWGWLMDPENQSGCPAVYRCVNCRRQFRWFEIDGDAGPYCDACDLLGLPRTKRPTLVAKSDRWGTVQTHDFDRTNVATAPESARKTLTLDGLDVVMVRAALVNYAEFLRLFNQQYKRAWPAVDERVMAGKIDLARCEQSLARIDEGI